MKLSEVKVKVSEVKSLSLRDQRFHALENIIINVQIGLIETLLPTNELFQQNKNKVFQIFIIHAVSHIFGHKLYS